jgi:3-deoxy-7-phosphoheptulonate synthase
MSLAPPDAAVARTTLPSHHQPLWEDRDDVELVTTVLHGASPIVWPDEIDLLAASLAKLDPTDLVIQAGDCVEDLADATPARTLEKATGLVALGDIARSVNHRVLLAGRIGGQYAKPRSAPFETHAGKTFMTFRGPIVHAPKADERRRAGNVHRIATCWIASEIVTATLRKTPVPGFAADRIWTSHEALLFDYEAPQIREYRDRRYLTSTAWPWVGNRTRTVGSPHLALVWDIVNPVSLKVSGGTDAADLVHIARTLNPRNEAGRLSFIARFGVDRISELAPLVRAVVDAGIQVRWISDPMHGNTFTNSQDIKTRLVADILAEATTFSSIVRAYGVSPGGIHLETTVDDVDECVWDRDALIDPHRYTTGCDPRLSSIQAQHVIEKWVAA